MTTNEHITPDLIESPTDPETSLYSPQKANSETQIVRHKYGTRLRKTHRAVVGVGIYQ